MDIKLIFGVLVLLILGSIQYTLNLILREIKGMRISLMDRRNDGDTENIYRR